MKKNILYLFISILTITQVNAQNNREAATAKGDFIFDIGIGFIGGHYKGYTTNWNYSNNAIKAQLPTFSIALQHAFWNDVTIGGQVAFNIFGNVHDVNQGNGYYQHSEYTQSNLYILGRGEYHFNRLIGWSPKYDLYAGALAGGRISSSAETNIYEGWGYGQPGSWRNDYPNRLVSEAGPAGGIFGGMRYYFTPRMAVYGEAGFGITALRAGLSWRL